MPAASVETNWLIVVTPETLASAGPVADVDTAMGQAISSSKTRSDFKGKAKDLLTFYQATGVVAENVVVVGVGEVSECDLRVLRQSLLAALRLCCTTEQQAVAIVFDSEVVERFGIESIAELFGDCVTSAPTDAGIYKAERSHFPFREARLVLTAAHSDAEAAVTKGAIIGDACNLVKDLVNRTAENINPISFAQQAVALADELGLESLVLADEELEKERMGAMLAVARGSAYPARMVRLAYKGAGDGPTLALVGKGVTFDSGGYSIKPSDSMITMKADMAGAATAMGILSLIHI